MDQRLMMAILAMDAYNRTDIDQIATRGLVLPSGGFIGNAELSLSAGITVTVH
jgi:hypothetical protein